MADEVYICECGFKCVGGQLNKSKKKCPKCGQSKDQVS